VTFRLHPVQAGAQTWTVRSGDVRVLAALQQKLLDAAMSIESLQMRSDDEGFALDVRFASLPEVLREHEVRLREMCGALEVMESGEDVWQAQERLFAVECETVLKVTVLPTKIAAVLEGFAALKGAGEASAVCVADASGIVTVALTACAEHAAAIVEDLRSRVRGEGGMVVVLRGDVGLERWGGSPPAIAVMRAVKEEFDPLRLLNPGKFVGGI
jgi:glycolate oxidase FAD binding subunit